jgi:8-oxo-dGTP pyrophosphatase MutT (NUDIX family)
VHRFASIALVDARGWILLQERDEFPVIDPEKWGFPGGGVEDGEDYEAAAHRELEEETGIRLERGGLELLDVFTVYHAHHDSDDQMALFVGRVELADEDIVVGEGRRIVFVDPATIPELELTAGAAVALPRFVASETYRRLVGDA